jgi:glycine/D-amino acid oxidase-like deaminating enzyme
VTSSLADARPVPFWLDDPDRPEPLPPLTGRVRTDLTVVGGGFSGLWTALLAKQRDPGRDVLLVEAARIGWAATGRNGGFCDASLTHGVLNGMAHFPDENKELVRLGDENLAGIEDTVRAHDIDCDWRRTGTLSVATQDWQVAELGEYADLCGLPLLSAAEVRAEVDSPTYLAGLWDRDGTAIVNPARLAWGLRDACVAAGVRIAESTRVSGLASDGTGMVVRGPDFSVFSDRVALATNVFPALVRRARPYVVPVYDYVLVTEPLSDAQLADVGWRHRQGIGDSGNQFHYYRLTAGNRILWGGYDAVYHYGNRVGAGLDQRPATFTRLADHFFATFPQLEGLRFTHTWGGAIDTCTRFCPFFGTAHRGRVAYVAGYTGLGVGASRFGAQVLLDLLGGSPTALTELELVRRRPVPFPPEPLRYVGVQLTRASLAAADRNGGRRNLWLRTLDRFGIGFDS